MTIRTRHYLSLLVGHETQLWNCIERALRESHAPLTLGRFNALSIIDDVGNSSRVQEVANQLDITVGAASRLVDRLAADGLVERVAHSTDRRSFSLLLTERGREALIQTRLGLDDALADLFDEVGEGTLELVISGLESIQQTLQQRKGKIHG